MKTLFLFSLTMLLSFGFISANHLSGELHIINPQHREFSAQLNHRNFTREANTQILKNVPAGNHHIRLAEVHYDHFGRKNFRVFAQQQIYIEPGTKHIAVLNAYNELVLVKKERIHGQLPVVCATGQVNTYPLPPVHPVGVSDHDFNQFLAIVGRQSFESTKLNMIRTFIRQNDLNSYQVKSLMHALTFESSRLEIAKLAYGHVLDPNNYYLVNDAFQFESSIRQLNRALYG